MSARRGFSLIELIVAVTIFVTVITLAIGGVASISRTKMLIASMKESQQKTRLITEIMTRYGKEAVYTKVHTSGNRVDYFFEDKKFVSGVLTTVKSAKVFRISTPTGNPPMANSLLYYDCGEGSLDDSGIAINTTSSTNIDSGGDANSCIKQELLTSMGGFSFNLAQIGSEPFFKKGQTIPATINMNFTLKNITTTNAYFNDDMQIKKIILLENLK